MQNIGDEGHVDGARKGACTWEACKGLYTISDDDGVQAAACSAW
jgi:hypothetical protein